MNNIIHNEELKQINWLDERFYFDGENYYPSVTQILDVYPKGAGFAQFLKDVGNNAKQIVERAGEIGSIVHEATEMLNKGEELIWTETGNYTLEQWKLICVYADFWETIKPKLIANEANFVSKKLGFGGTLDRVVMIGSKRWLLDIKTSNAIYTTHELQQAAYAFLWNEKYPDEPIEDTGIIWLKANIRTNKFDLDKEVFQGISDAGAWQIKRFKRHYTDAFKIFEHTLAIWREENPDAKPANKIFPDTIKLEKY